MLKLIRLEWKKNRIGRYIRIVVILAAVLCLFIYALAYFGIADDPGTGRPDAAPGHQNISSPIELFTGMSYLVFSSVMLSSFIVNAYQNKTMHLMFSYPIKRQKIIVSQMAAAWIFNFAALVLTKLLLYGAVLFGSRFQESSFPIDYNMAAFSFYVELILKSVVIVSMGFLALYIGMAMHSSKAAVVSSFVLIFFTQANVGSYTLAGNRVLPAVLTVVSLFSAFLIVWRVEVRDIV